jgi:hypothetical protein
MRVFQETTKDWVGNVTNHIYYTNDSKSKIIAFYNTLTGEVTKFKQPIRWDMRYRTFKELKRK